MTEWSPKQDEALKAVDYWFKNDTKENQVFKLFGCAGTGKTTLAKHFAQNIDGQVSFAAYTGKAAHVLAQKGCQGATTIHRLIYQPKITSKAHLETLQLDLDQALAHPEPDGELITRIKEEITKEQENAGRMSFSLNLQSDLRYAKLLIVDEVSMVDQTIGEDLLSFNIPILVLGDPEQLPPIYGQGYFTNCAPDIMLTEIHRQALDNPIIAMAEIVRSGKSLPLGTYGSSRVVDQRISSEEMLQYNMILTGLRRTKKIVDDECRRILGHTSPMPKRGDKVMCVKNNHSMGLLNGQMWDVVSDTDPMTVGMGSVSLHVRNPDTDIELALVAAEKLFYGQQLDRWEHEEDIQEFEYAYGITVHKAQGSQWDNVLLFDQKDRFPMMSARDKQRWLYTGITRAAENVTVMRL